MRTRGGGRVIATLVYGLSKVKGGGQGRNCFVLRLVWGVGRGCPGTSDPSAVVPLFGKGGGGFYSELCTITR